MKTSSILPSLFYLKSICDLHGQKFKKVVRHFNFDQSWDSFKIFVAPIQEAVVEGSCDALSPGNIIPYV